MASGWKTVLHAINVTRADWDAAHGREPTLRLEGRGTSKVTHVARLALLAGVASFFGIWLTREPGLAGVGLFCGLVALAAGWLRRINVGRWFL